MTNKIKTEPLNTGYWAGLFKSDNQSLAGVMAKGASGILVLKMVNTGLVFATAVILARSLGVRGYGIYAYALSWVTLLGVFARLGLDQTIGRHVAIYHQVGDWARIHGLLRFSFGAVASAAVVCLLCAGAISWFVYKDAAEIGGALWLALLILPVNALMVPCGAAQTGLLQVVPAQVPMLLVQPLGFLVLVGGVWMVSPGEISPRSVLAIYLLTACLSLILAAWLLKRGIVVCGGKEFASVRPVYEIRAWMNSALPLMLMGGMFLANANVDILILGAMVGPEAVAIFKAATRGAELVVLSLSVIIPPLAPLIAKLKTVDDQERLQKGITRTAQVSFLMSFLIAIPLIIFGNKFLSLFGEEFIHGHVALYILIVGQLVNAATGISGTILVMCGLEKKAALGLLLGTIVNITLNYFFIPIWGINGSAIATCVSIVVWTSALTIFVIKYLNLNPTFFPLYKK